MSTPKCFESEQQWKDYKHFCKSAKPTKSGYCSDCLPAFKMQMLRQCRCEHVGVVFRQQVVKGDRVFQEDSELVGVRPGARSRKA